MKVPPKYKETKNSNQQLPQLLKHLGTQFRHQNRGIQAGRIRTG